MTRNNCPIRPDIRYPRYRGPLWPMIANLKSGRELNNISETSWEVKLLLNCQGLVAYNDNSSFRYFASQVVQLGCTQFSKINIGEKMRYIISASFTCWRSIPRFWKCTSRARGRILSSSRMRDSVFPEHWKLHLSYHSASPWGWQEMNAQNGRSKVQPMPFYRMSSTWLKVFTKIMKF